MERGSRFIVAATLIYCVLCWLAVTAFALPGRAYEMVSPLYKAGFGVLAIEGVSPDGEKVAFYSPGAFANAPSGLTVFDYIAHRTTSGWSTLSEMAPAVLSPDIGDRDLSPTLGTVLNMGKSGPNKEAAQESTEEQFLLHETDLPNTAATWELAGFGLKTLLEKRLILVYGGASSDFCHLLFFSVGEALLPEAVNARSPVYELERGCEGVSPTLRLVAQGSANNALSPGCQVDIGLDDYDTAYSSSYNAIAANGREIFFTVCVANQIGDHQLFVRLSGTTTLEVSKPLSETETCVETVACKEAAVRASADFAGASEDGSTVFFTTAAQLESEDTDSGNDLYMARIGCPEGQPECEVSERKVRSLVRVSHVVGSGEVAEVQGVVRVAPDGSHVYFAARGALSGVNAAGATPVKGADNLYSYDRATEKISFIGQLCSGAEASGLVGDLDCPNPHGSDEQLWLGVSEAQTGGSDGKFLVFASYAQMTGDDTDTAKDVYRYDADTGELTRVSVGEEGADANGNEGAFDATIAVGNKGRSVRFQYELNSRAISEDGSEIVFTTRAPLSPDALNRLPNLYLWHQGKAASGGDVSLLSSGSAEAPDSEPVTSASGHDIVFRTVQGLVPLDRDGAPDVYDARVDGGFPSQPVSREECSADACQGPLTNPAPLLVPSSTVQAPGENFGPAGVKASKAKKSKAKRKAKKTPVRKKGKAKRARRSSHPNRPVVSRGGSR